jgi:hypothetical protein
MFGKKKKENNSINMNESYTDNSDIPDEMVQQIYRQPQQNQQPMNQPVYQNPLQLQQVQTQPIQNSMFPQYQQYPQNQQIQQPVQKPRTAIIVKSEIQENGEILFTGVANYHINLGICRLEQ